MSFRRCKNLFTAKSQRTQRNSGEQRTASDSEFVTIYNPLNDGEAQIIAARLTSAGIRAVITGQSAMLGTPVSFGIIPHIEIKVPESEVDTAVEVLIDLGYLEAEDPDEEV